MNSRAHSALDQGTASLFADGIDCGDQFSADRKYRYRLWRIWDPTKTVFLFCMLNPSLATWDKLDNTCLRVQRFVQKWQGGGFIVTNCFGLVDTNPAGLYTSVDPVGPENDVAIRQAATRADVVVAAWGNHAGLGQRADAVYQLLVSVKKPIHCLAITKTGEPGHPLYLSSNLKPQIYDRTIRKPAQADEPQALEP